MNNIAFDTVDAGLFQTNGRFAILGDGQHRSEPK
jgi:hypothetical protein